MIYGNSFRIVFHLPFVISLTLYGYRDISLTESETDEEQQERGKKSFVLLRVLHRIPRGGGGRDVEHISSFSSRKKWRYLWPDISSNFLIYGGQGVDRKKTARGDE